VQSWHPGEQTPVLRIEMLRFRRVIVILGLLLLSRGRPRLIRNQAIGRIDDPAGDARVRSGHMPIEIRLTVYWIGQRRRPAGRSSPDALHVRLTVWQVIRRPRSGYFSPIPGWPASLPNHRHRRREERRGDPESHDHTFESHLGALISGYG